MTTMQSATSTEFAAAAAECARRADVARRRGLAFEADRLDRESRQWALLAQSRAALERVS